MRPEFLTEGVVSMPLRLSSGSLARALPLSAIHFCRATTQLEPAAVDFGRRLVLDPRAPYTYDMSKRPIRARPGLQ